MDFILKRMNIKNFKGIREKTIDFDETFTRIAGANGTYKSTTMTAFFWLFTNRDCELANDPPIFPLNVQETTPEVEAIFTINGKPGRMKKIQTRKVTFAGDTQKVSFTNSFFYNDVPISNRDATKKLEELGIDMTRFMELSHPDAFLNLKKDDQRSILFGMTNSLTDADVASRMGDEVKEVCKQLENYNISEIRAMAKATLKKISEVYGDHGEILNSKIEGLEESKVDYDFGDLEILKNSLEEKMQKIKENRQHNLTVQKSLDILAEKDMSLQFDISGLKNSVASLKNEKCEAMKKEVETLKASLESKSDLYKAAYVDKETNLKMLESNRIDIDFVKKQLADAQALTFDTTTETCPTCSQRLPETDIQTLHKNFEDSKAKKIADYEKEISFREKQITDRKKKDKELDTRIETLKAEGKTIQEEYVKKRDAFQLYRDTPMDEDITKNLVIKERELAEVRKKVEELKASYIPNVDLEEVELKAQMSDTDRKLGQAEVNCQIDGKIEELRNKQTEYEQNRADAEKILYQLDLIQRRKNELLTDEINKHFSLVKWKFFDFLRNGNYTECCIPMVDDKELGTSLNTAMQVRAKIDICDSLQKFYEQHIPIWLDGAECLDSNSQESLITETQMILLIVKD